MHVNYLEAQSPSVGVVWMLGDLRVSSVTIATKEWGRVRLQHLPVKGLDERSYHKGLFLHVTPSTPDGMSRMQVYLDCKWQGYFMMPLSLFQMAKEALGNKLRAVSKHCWTFLNIKINCSR
ncbi:uncharacterized protein TNCV_2024301 [Trichonephila clavipes]|nr:uncharacterized protein TNCV_2024301 [Trichonephila clavipes]